MSQPNVRVLLITGPAGSGKSTVWRRMRALQEMDEAQMLRKFAGPLKEMIMSGFGLGYDHTEGLLKEVPLSQFGGVTPRHMMQTLGTDWGRTLIHPDLWAMAAVAEVNKLIEERSSEFNTLTVVFDDARFGNEISLMREAFPNTRVLKLVPSYPEYTPIEGSGHASEVQQLDWDVSIDNDGDLSKFCEDLDHGLEDIWA